MTLSIHAPRTATLWAAGLVTCLAIAGCEAREPGPAADTAAVAPAAEAPATPSLTDPQIAHIAVTANAIDSAAGELAKTRARSADVRTFAETMIADHGGVNAQAVALVQRLGVTPEANDVSGQLQHGADQARTALEAASGAEFDRAYIQREIEYHQAVLDALDQSLIPNARNAELKALLEGVRPAFVAHLERARQIQGSLGSS